MNTKKKFFIVMAILATLLVATTAIVAANGGELPFEIVWTRESDANAGPDSVYFVEADGCRLLCVKDASGVDCEVCGPCAAEAIVIEDVPSSDKPKSTPTVETTPTKEPSPTPTEEPPAPTEEPCNHANPGNDKCVGNAGECPNGDCEKFGWPDNGNKGASNGKNKNK